MKLDPLVWKFFDTILDFQLGNIELTYDTYPTIFEEKFNDALQKLPLCIGNIKLSEQDIDDLKHDCYHKYINKCSYQSPKIDSLVDPDHEKWLEKKAPDIEWNQWNVYSNYLKTEKKFNDDSVNAIGELADKIIDRLEDPESEKEIKVKGLLMGEVQSGKTGTYMSVLHKAADVGWRFIIVLSGLTDDLRFQTQQRINFDFIGYTLSSRTDRQNCGIRAVSKEYDYIGFEPLTTSHEDFAQSKLSKNIEDRKDRLYIAVCKKNSQILKNLLKWLGADPNNPEKNADRREIAQKIPCLIVDDEADQASPNTKKAKQEFTAVNGAIRNLLNFFNKSAYLAVTATPYANIFINPQFDYTKEQYNLPDLFPNNFIFVKKTPYGYTGVHELFGVDESDEETDIFKNKLEEKVVITIEHTDEETFRKPLKKDDIIEKLPPSLVTALRYYFCCCVFKEITIDSHASMLAHIDYRKEHHKTISGLISEFYENEFNAIKLERGLSETELENNARFKAYREIWEKSCFSKSVSLRETDTFVSLSSKPFTDVWKNHLLTAIEKIRIETINSDYKGEKLADIYDKYKNSKLILVGGYALSRGITIEGLCVTYLARKSATIDTLLQMGRFFGFRGYDIKIMKIWLSQNIKEMFEEADLAQQEFIQQVRIMNDHDQTPSSFGFKIHQSPAYLKLRIVARNKMYHSKELVLDANIAGYPLQSAKLPFEIDVLKKNRDVVCSFIDDLKKNFPVTNEKNENYSDIVWKDVDSLRISKLISDFTAYGYGDINSATIADHILEKLKNEKWIVTVISNKKESHDKMDLFNLGQDVVSISTDVLVMDQGKKFIYIPKGALLRGSDFSRRLTNEEKEILKRAYSKNSLSNTDIVRNQPNLPLKPQLIIYSIQPNFIRDAVQEKDYKNLLCGLAIGVPCTKNLERSTLKVRYVVNDTFLFNTNREE